MMKSSVSTLLIVSSFVFALTACGSDEPSTVAQTPPAITVLRNTTSPAQASTPVIAPMATVVARQPAQLDTASPTVTPFIANGATTATTATASKDTAAAPVVAANTGSVATTIGAADSTTATTADAPAQGPGVMGQVIAVAGATLTVQDQRQQSTTTVAVDASTQIFKQTTITLADVPVGETLSAVGTQADNTFTARAIRIGVPTERTGNGPGGLPPAGGAPPRGDAPAGAPPMGGGQGQPGGDLGTPLFGTVTGVTSTALTVQTTDGTTVSVTLATDGQITQQVTGSSADLTTGILVMAMGETSGTLLSATRIEIMPAMGRSRKGQ